MLQRSFAIVVVAIMMTLVGFVSAPAEAHAAGSVDVSQDGCVTYYDQSGRVTSTSCGAPIVGGVAREVYRNVRNTQEWAGVKGREIQGQLIGQQAADWADYAYRVGNETFQPGGMLRVPYKAADIAVGGTLPDLPTWETGTDYIFGYNEMEYYGYYRRNR